MYSPNNIPLTFKFEKVDVIFISFCFFFFFSKLRENKKTAELIKTANLLFNSFEPYYMWDYVARWFEECCRYVKLFYSFSFNSIQSQSLLFFFKFLSLMKRMFFYTFYYYYWQLSFNGHNLSLPCHSRIQNHWSYNLRFEKEFRDELFNHQHRWKIFPLQSIVIQFFFVAEKVANLWLVPQHTFPKCFSLWITKRSSVTSMFLKT